MVRLTSLVPIASLVASAYGHAAMYFPVSRNVAVTYDLKTGANGPSVCGSGRNTMWHANDELASALVSPLTTPLTELKAGGKVEIEIVISATHQGHSILELCAAPGDVITDDCFIRLERDPTDTRFSPYTTADPHAFFMPVNDCLGGATEPQNSIKVRYLVPEGIESDHAVLRWYWQTGNSCTSHPLQYAPNVPQELKDWEAENINGRRGCKVAISSGEMCGESCPHPGCTNEQFKNCADVKIVPGTATDLVTRGGRPIESNGRLPGEWSYGDADYVADPNPGNPGNPGTGNPGNPGSGELAKGLEECVAGIKGVASHYDGHCADQCHQYGAPGSFGETWCMAGGKTNLLQCVLSAQSAACIAA